MQEPILTFEGLDLIVHATASDAAGHVESYDVDAVHAFDPVGHVLRFEAEGRNVSLRETGDCQPERLRNELLMTFKAAGVSVAPDTSLDQLIELASERFSADRSLTSLGRLIQRLFFRSA